MAVEDAEYLLRQFENQIDEQLTQAARLKSEMELVRATAQSRRGDVEVTVDASGGLADVHLTREAMDRQPDELAAELVAVGRSAQAQLAAKMSQTMAGVLGEGSETARFVTDTYTERFAAAEDPDVSGGTRR